MIKYPAIFQQSIVLQEWLHLSLIAANSFVSAVCTVEHHASAVARGRHTAHVRTPSPHPRSSQCSSPSNKSLLLHHCTTVQHYQLAINVAA